MVKVTKEQIEQKLEWIMNNKDLVGKVNPKNMSEEFNEVYNSLIEHPEQTLDSIILDPGENVVFSYARDEFVSLRDRQETVIMSILVSHVALMMDGLL